MKTLLTITSNTGGGSHQGSTRASLTNSVDRVWQYGRFYVLIYLGRTRCRHVEYTNEAVPMFSGYRYGQGKRKTTFREIPQ